MIFFYQGSVQEVYNCDFVSVGNLLKQIIYNGLLRLAGIKTFHTDVSLCGLSM